MKGVMAKRESISSCLTFVASYYYHTSLQYYTVAVGKLNVPKMVNFLEIDVYVLVACPENSLIESREFFKPVITPFELELACVRCVSECVCV